MRDRLPEGLVAKILAEIVASNNTDLLTDIRTLVLCFDLGEFLLQASNGMMSLRFQRLQLRLHEFVVEITSTSLADLMEELGGPASMGLLLRSSRLKTCEKRATYCEDCEAWVKAVKIAEVAKMQCLRIRIFPWNWYGAKAAERCVSKTAITNTRSAAQIVKCAVRNDLEKI